VTRRSSSPKCSFSNDGSYLVSLPRGRTCGGPSSTKGLEQGLGGSAIFSSQVFAALESRQPGKLAGRKLEELPILS